MTIKLILIPVSLLMGVAACSGASQTPTPEEKKVSSETPETKKTDIAEDRFNLGVPASTLTMESGGSADGFNLANPAELKDTNRDTIQIKQGTTVTNPDTALPPAKPDISETAATNPS